MALALAIVSFSCTRTIVGTLLVEAASKIAHHHWDVRFSLALATLYAFRYVPRMVEFYLNQADG
jgi:hypothetical protein